MEDGLGWIESFRLHGTRCAEVVIVILADLLRPTERNARLFRSLARAFLNA